MKKCCICEKPKPLSEFSRRTANKDGHRNECRRCAKERDQAKAYAPDMVVETKRKRRESQKRWLDQNPEKRLEIQAKKRGITLGKLREMQIAQNNVCAICGNPSQISLCIDHNHDTGRVRGLLCKDCNSGLGFFKDNEQFLINATGYLQTRNS